MTENRSAPPWARPVLEALRDAARWMRVEVTNEHEAHAAACKQRVAWLDLEWCCARLLTAALAAGAPEGEPFFHSLGCPRVSGRGTASHCTCPPDRERPEQTPPGVAEVEAFHRRVRELGSIEAVRELEAPAPDAELDRLLIEYARCQVQARYASRSQPEINRRAYAVEYAAAAIHAHVARVTQEARGEVIGTALIKPRWEHGDEYTPHICMGDWRRNGGTEPFYVDLVRRREEEEA